MFQPLLLFTERKNNVLLLIYPHLQVFRPGWPGICKFGALEVSVNVCQSSIIVHLDVLATFTFYRTEKQCIVADLSLFIGIQAGLARHLGRHSRILGLKPSLNDCWPSVIVTFYVLTTFAQNCNRILVKSRSIFCYLTLRALFWAGQPALGPKGGGAIYQYRPNLKDYLSDIILLFTELKNIKY